MIRIDLSSVIESFRLSNQEADDLASSMVERMASRCFANITDLAKTKLHKSRADYLSGLRMTKPQRNVAMIELIGTVPNMVEAGVGAFDMKSGFEKSKNATAKKDGGWYLTVPFQHAWSGALGEASYFSGVMPAAVHAAASRLGDKERLNASSLPGGLGAPSSRKAVVGESREFAEYKNKSSIYSGMIKSTKAGHTGYTTFRRVSDKSDENSWVHSGIEERDLFGKAEMNTNILREVDMARDEFIDNLGL